MHKSPALPLRAWRCAVPALGAAVLFAALPVRADVFGIAWDQARHAVTRIVTPGGFVELCGPLEAGEAVEWRFDSSMPTDFNIHFHEGGKLTSSAQRASVRQAQGRLSVAGAHEYCWMWTNKSSAKAEVKVELRRERAPVAASRSRPR